MMLQWDRKQVDRELGSFTTLWWCVLAQSCPTFCVPMDCSLPDSSVHEILQARILEWFAISFSRASSQLRDWTHIFYVSCICRQVLYRCTTLEALLIYLFFSLLMSPIGEHSYGTQISLHFLPIQRGSSHFFPRFWSHKVSSRISSKLPTISQTSGHSPLTVV